MDVEIGGAGAPPQVGGPAVAATAAAATTSGRLVRRPGAPAGWRGVVREVAVIAAGALAALGAQAWWQDRQDRQREQDYLRQLLADTRENERRLDGAIADDSTAGRAIYGVVRAFVRPGPLPPSDTLRRWIGRSMASSDFKPVVGTFTALVGTGDLRLVRTDSLRPLIVAYASSAEHERQMLQFILELGVASVDVLPRTMPFVRYTFLDDADRPRPAPFDFAPLRDDPEVASVLFRLQASNSNRMNHLRRLRDQTRQLRRALEAERGARGRT